MSRSFPSVMSYYKISHVAALNSSTLRPRRISCTTRSAADVSMDSSPATGFSNVPTLSAAETVITPLQWIDPQRPLTFAVALVAMVPAIVRRFGFAVISHRRKAVEPPFFGMVQFHMPKGDTFQAGAMATNNHNSLSKQELRGKWQLVGFGKVLPCSEPGPFFLIFC